jgi:HAD superfamily hydrolase (TIGR01509 family)
VSEVVLFDLDGTLVDTWDLYVEAYLRALERLRGRRPTFDELRALKPTSELRLFEEVLGPDEARAGHGVFLEEYGTLHADLFGGVYPGVVEMLETVRRRGAAVGIVTGKSRGAWEITREHLDGALGKLRVVVTDDAVETPKPDPQGLRHALRALGIGEARTLYVGDSEGDAGAAAGAGMAFGAALWAKGEGEIESFLTAVRHRIDPVVLWEPGQVTGWLGGEG